MVAVHELSAISSSIYDLGYRVYSGPFARMG